VNVRNVFLWEGIEQQHHTLTIKNVKSCCGECMWNAGDNKQMYEQTGQYWNDIGKLLPDVLSQTAYRTQSKGKKKHVQNLILGVSPM
jgi:hypothetical protein